MKFSRCWWSAKGKRACSPNSPDFDSSEPEEMNDPADDINFDAAFVKDSDISGAREALGKFLQELESIGIMSHEEIADAVQSLPLPQKQASSFPKGHPAFSVKQALVEYEFITEF
jgi:hypothetical protein